MTKKNTKFTPVLINSKDGLTAALNTLVSDKLALAALKIAMEEEIAAIQRRNQGRVEALTRDIAANEAGIQVFVTQRREELFPKGVKSLDFALATVGFRDTPHRVEKARSKDTFDEIALRMAGLVIHGEQLTDPATGEPLFENGEPARVVIFDGNDYVRYADPDLDKKALLSNRQNIPAEALKAAGIKFDYDELFYIEPKSEVIEGKTEVAA